MLKKLTEFEHYRLNDITIEEVKACPLFAHISDDEAEEVIDTIKRFSVIIFNYYQAEKVKKSL